MNTLPTTKGSTEFHPAGSLPVSFSRLYAIPGATSTEYRCDEHVPANVTPSIVFCFEVNRDPDLFSCSTCSELEAEVRPAMGDDHILRWVVSCDECNLSAPAASAEYRRALVQAHKIANPSHANRIQIRAAGVDDRLAERAEIMDDQAAFTRTGSRPLVTPPAKLYARGTDPAVRPEDEVLRLRARVSQLESENLRLRRHEVNAAEAFTRIENRLKAAEREAAESAELVADLEAKLAEAEDHRSELRAVAEADRERIRELEAALQVTAESLKREYRRGCGVELASSALLATPHIHRYLRLMDPGMYARVAVQVAAVSEEGYRAPDALPVADHSCRCDSADVNVTIRHEDGWLRHEGPDGCGGRIAGVVSADPTKGGAGR